MLSGAQILRIGLPMFAVGSATAIAVLLVRPYIGYDGSFEDVSAWGAFFSVFGVVYAIVAGFVLITVLTRYGALSQTIEDELNAVESIRDFLVYFKGVQHAPAQAVKRALANYVQAVASIEWEQMANVANSTNSDTSDELYAVMRSTGDIEPMGERDKAILSAVIANVSDLTKMRTRRISLANERLPPRLRLLILFMSVVLVASFLAVSVRSTVAHVFMTSALSVSAYLLYWIIEDLDHPFYGVWNIDRTPLEELLERFKSELSGAA